MTLSPFLFCPKNHIHFSLHWNLFLGYSDQQYWPYLVGFLLHIPRSRTYFQVKSWGIIKVCFSPELCDLSKSCLILLKPVTVSDPHCDLSSVYETILSEVMQSCVICAAMSLWTLGRSENRISKYSSLVLQIKNLRYLIHSGL